MLGAWLILATCAVGWLRPLVYTQIHLVVLEERVTASAETEEDRVKGIKDTNHIGCDGRDHISTCSAEVPGWANSR